MTTPFPLVQADGEQLPFRDASFDIVLSDHGSMNWADPHRTVPEAARVLRPEGLLVFNASTPWHCVCQSEDVDAPVPTSLVADYFGLHRIEEGDGATTFVLPYGEWSRLFRHCGLVTTT